MTQESAFFLPDAEQAAAFVADVMAENLTPAEAVPYCADAALVLCSIVVSANAGPEGLPGLSGYFQSIKAQIVERYAEAMAKRRESLQ